MVFITLVITVMEAVAAVAVTTKREKAASNRRFYSGYV